MGTFFQDTYDKVHTVKPTIKVNWCEIKIRIARYRRYVFAAAKPQEDMPAMGGE